MAGIKSKHPKRLEIPDWVKHFPPLHRMYWNPVFQRAIMRHVMDFGITKRGAFVTGVVISVILSMITSMIPEIRMIITVCLIGLAVTIIFIRLLGTALVSTARNMSNVMAEEMKDPVLTTPIKNASIYYGVTIGTIMRGYPVIESMVSFINGIILAYACMFLLAIGANFMLPVEVYLIPASWLLSLVLISAGMLALCMLVLMMLAFASGLYATFLDPLTSVIMSIFTFAVVDGFGGAILYVPFLLRDINTMQNVEIIRGLMFGGLFLIGWLSLATLGIAWTGVLTLAKRRCPGFYEPDEITSADQALRGL